MPSRICRVHFVNQMGTSTGVCFLLKRRFAELVIFKRSVTVLLLCRSFISTVDGIICRLLCVHSLPECILSQIAFNKALFSGLFTSCAFSEYLCYSACLP
jgi:hypothetical protein